MCGLRPARLLFVVVVASWAGPAAALNNFDYLDWACGGGKVKDGDVASALLEECGGAEQPAQGRTVCQVIAGTPFACYTQAASQPAESLCSGGAVSFSVTGNTGGYLGWSVTGTVDVTGVVTFKKTVSNCTVTPIQPPPDGDGGTYVVMAGSATMKATFQASGTGHITFLGMRVFGTSFTKSCSEDITRQIYSTDTTVGCEARDPTCCEIGDETCCDGNDGDDRDEGHEDPVPEDPVH